jgi:hypothetical protein
MSIDQSTLTKSQIRKLNALRKSIGDDIAEDAFGKWMKTQFKTPKEVRDPVADALVTALSHLNHDKSFKLGNKGYLVKRSKGKGVSGLPRPSQKLLNTLGQ